VLAAMIWSFLLPASPTSATPATSGGWTTNGSASPTSVRRGQALALTVTATSTSTRRALVDVEVYTSTGTKVLQQAWDNQAFTAGTQRSFTTSWTVPAAEALTAHTVRVGIFSPGWGQLYHWNNSAASFTVTAAAGTTTTTTTTTQPPSTTTTTTRPPTTTTTTTAPPPAGHFNTLPPGAALPSDATCAAQVRRTTTEIRPQNATYNQTKGFGSPANPPQPLYKRVTGNFTGTTDEIIQWAACKWGIDEDIVRAQTAKESYWTMTAVGDNGESFGLMQVRKPYWAWAFNNGVGDAQSSSAFNMDAALAARRNCFEGNETWLGGSYAKGDIWGCVGLWFSGRWHDAGAEQYITDVKGYLNPPIWTTPGFINYR
jgi:autotransporter family porin